jgi:hypothetical protein
MDNEITNKIIGYFLLAIGISIILFSAYKIYLTFTGTSLPPNIFNFEPITISLPDSSKQLGNLKQEILSKDAINKPLDYGFYLMLMGFLSSTGFRVASLGIQLVRTIKVNVREQKQIL